MNIYYLFGLIIVNLIIIIIKLKYDNMVKEFEIEELLKEIKKLKHED